MDTQPNRLTVSETLLSKIQAITMRLFPVWQGSTQGSKVFKVWEGTGKEKHLLIGVRRKKKERRKKLHEMSKTASKPYKKQTKLDKRPKHAKKNTKKLENWVILPPLRTQEEKENTKCQKGKGKGKKGNTND